MKACLFQVNRLSMEKCRYYILQRGGLKDNKEAADKNVSSHIQLLTIKPPLYDARGALKWRHLAIEEARLVEYSFMSELHVATFLTLCSRSLTFYDFILDTYE